MHPPKRDVRVLAIPAEQLVENLPGLLRLCAALGISTRGKAPYEVAYAYLRWCKRNPQPRADKR